MDSIGSWSSPGFLAIVSHFPQVSDYLLSIWRESGQASKVLVLLRYLERPIESGHVILAEACATLSLDHRRRQQLLLKVRGHSYMCTKLVLNW